MTNKLSRQQVDMLLTLARQAISAKLTGQELPGQTELEPVFHERVATFVTLKIGGQLRGCIGNLEPVGTLWNGVRDNALNAAFHDYRFDPLKEEELERVHIGISILTSPQKLHYANAEELTRLLRPGVDGVILRCGRSGATFLPQVWQQLPEVETFLSHLCRKAGLQPDCWQTEHPEIQTYQVQSYGEEEA